MPENSLKLKVKSSTPIESGSKLTSVSPMAALLAKSKAKFKILHKGEVVKGTITKLTPQEILVDIAAKTEALVLEKDRRILRNLMATLKVGDVVEVSVLTPESDMGYPVVSLRKFSDDRNWELLYELMSKRESVDVAVTEATRGGLLVESSFGVSGFLPNSQTSLVVTDKETIGRKIKVYISELNRSQRKVIFSEKRAINDEDFKQMTKSLTVGNVADVTITSITNFGLFAAIPNKQETIEGLIHISEIAWEKVSNLEEMYKAGDTVKAEIIGIDSDSKRIELSVKRLTKDPFEDAVKDLAIDQKVNGEVTLVTDMGINIKLPNGVEGIVRKEKIPPTKTYEVGEELSLIVSQIDKNRRKVYLVPVLLEKPIGYR